LTLPLKALRSFFRFILAVFFRRLTVVGEDRLARQGPLLLVANHVNSLLDPLLLLCVSPRVPRFLAKAPLFRHPLVAPFLKLLQALPVQRRQDPGSDPSKNAATFEACEAALAAGEVVALFPEGLSHNEPHLMPLKTGAARILGRALRRGAQVAVVPVGLVYTDRTAFRSEVTVVVGEPVPYGDLDFGQGEEPAAVEAFTGRLAEALRSVTVNAERWEDLELVEGLAPLALEVLGEGGEEPGAKTRVALTEAYYEVRKSHPAELRRVLLYGRNYLRLLKLLGLTDADVARQVPPSAALMYLWRRLAVVVAGYPPALAGWAFHFVPYLLSGPLALLFARKEDVVATYKLYAGILLFGLWYGGAWWEAEKILGPWWSLLALGFLLPCGLWSLRYYELREEFVHVARAGFLLWLRKGSAERLRALREEVKAALDPVVKLYR
jgi:glycerol-3-phosphate O-acyltransferase/dihydroxyacetone phosphate acyltransferase